MDRSLGTAVACSNLFPMQTLFLFRVSLTDKDARDCLAICLSVCLLHRDKRDSIKITVKYMSRLSFVYVFLNVCYVYLEREWEVLDR